MAETHEIPDGNEHLQINHSISNRNSSSCDLDDHEHHHHEEGEEEVEDDDSTVHFERPRLGDGSSNDDDYDFEHDDDYSCEVPEKQKSAEIGRENQQPDPPAASEASLTSPESSAAMPFGTGDSIELSAWKHHAPRRCANRRGLAREQQLQNYQVPVGPANQDDGKSSDQNVLIQAEPSLECPHSVGVCQSESSDSIETAATTNGSIPKGFSIQNPQHDNNSTLVKRETTQSGTPALTAADQKTFLDSTKRTAQLSEFGDTAADTACRVTPFPAESAAAHISGHWNYGQPSVDADLATEAHGEYDGCTSGVDTPACVVTHRSSGGGHLSKDHRPGTGEPHLENYSAVCTDFAQEAEEGAFIHRQLLEERTIQTGKLQDMRIDAVNTGEPGLTESAPKQGLLSSASLGPDFVQGSAEYDSDSGPGKSSGNMFVGPRRASTGQMTYSDWTFRIAPFKSVGHNVKNTDVQGIPIHPNTSEGNGAGQSTTEQADPRPLDGDVCVTTRTPVPESEPNQVQFTSEVMGGEHDGSVETEDDESTTHELRKKAGTGEPRDMYDSEQSMDSAKNTKGRCSIRSSLINDQQLAAVFLETKRPTKIDGALGHIDHNYGEDDPNSLLPVVGHRGATNSTPSNVITASRLADLLNSSWGRFASFTIPHVTLTEDALALNERESGIPPELIMPGSSRHESGINRISIHGNRGDLRLESRCGLSAEDEEEDSEFGSKMYEDTPALLEIDKYKQRVRSHESVEEALFDMEKMLAARNGLGHKVPDFKPAANCTNASDFIVRCFVARLRNGVRVLKHNKSRWSRSSPRQLFLLPDGKTITWQPLEGELKVEKATRPRLDLTRCKEVRHAWSPDPDTRKQKGTSVLRMKVKDQNGAGRSFSLIFVKRTLDLTASTPDSCRWLMEGFSALCFRLQLERLLDSEQDVADDDDDDDMDRGSRYTSDDDWYSTVNGETTAASVTNSLAFSTSNQVYSWGF